MRKFYLVITLFFVGLTLSAQVVTTTPALPKATDEITIKFYADRGSGGLADYSGDVYAHIGVITEESTSSSDWKYVKAEWNENTDACKLTRESANVYTLVLTGDLYSFFGCPTTEKIEKIALVFRGATGSPEGKDDGGGDIFVDVYEDGLNISFERTDAYLLVNPDTTISFVANASIAADLSISINDVVKKTETSATSITYSETFSTSGDYKVVVSATQSGVTMSDTLLVCVVQTPTTAARPSGVVDGINYSGNSVTFVLYAPYKETVYVLGDFNNWTPSNDYQLKKDGDYWWITIDNLTAGEEYAFQYLVDQNIAIADPYSEKILDPWNDSYISDDVYPDLKAYPTGKAEGIVGVVAPGADEYQWDVTNFTPPTNDKLVVYELLVRDFVSSHDIKNITKELDYLEELGITAIELMPVNEFEGNNSWGYNPSFYFAFDKYYGTSDNYKAFIDSCHVRGIAVIMDMVLNHAYFQCPLVKLYFDADAGEYGQPSAQNPWFNETAPNTSYSWGADFNHESTHTQDFVKRVVEYWMTEYKIDGFRFDFTKGFTNTSGDGYAYDASRITTLKRIYNEIKSINSNAYMICEHFCASSEEKELANYGMMIWGNNNNAYMQCAMGWKDNSSILSVSHNNKGWDYPNVMAYEESHDEERMMSKALRYGNSSNGYNVKDTATALDRIELNAAFFLTIPGPKMIWQFGELGYDYSIDYNGRTGEKPIRWDYYNDTDRRDVYDVYSKINKLRAKYDVFSSWNHSITEFSSTFTKRINIYSDDVNVAVIGNFDVASQWVEPNFSATGKWYEFFSGDSVDVTSTDMGVELQPGEYRLYSNKKLTVDDVKDVELVDVPEIKAQEVKVFPNPVSNCLYVESEQTIDAVRLFNITGQLVKKQMCYSSKAQVIVSEIPAGTYLLQITGSNFNRVSKVVIE